MPLLDVTSETASLDGTRTLVKLQMGSEASRLRVIDKRSFVKLIMVFGWSIGLHGNIWLRHTPLYIPLGGCHLNL